MKRKQIIAICIAISTILAVSSVAYVILSPRHLGIGLITETGGWSHISDFYYPNDNVSYSVVFQGVNFTFLYWTYPLLDVTYTLSDAQYTAYFHIQFSDNTTEEIHFYAGDYFATNTWPLFITTTTHTSPKAGILHGGYLNKPTGWQFVVSFD